MQRNNSFSGRKYSSNKGRSNGRPGGFRSGGRRPGGGGFNKSRGPRKQTIHPSKFINKAQPVEDIEVYQPANLFTDFALNASLQANLVQSGFTSPTIVQDEAIPLALNGRDVIGLANTGTGKTVAFLLPILEKLYANREIASVLIMAPTRELAQQIDQEFRKFSHGMKLYSAVVVGGISIEKQIRELKRGPHVVIGTPGRLKDLLNRKVLRLGGINTFVLDEADRMLDMGFLPDIKVIASELPSQRQTMCFSATMTPTVSALVHNFMKDPAIVSVRSSVNSDHVDQDVIEASDKFHKIEILQSLLKKEEFDKVLVFGETKFGVQRLAKSLTDSNIPSEAIHGNKTQAQRQRALKAFKDEKVKVLVATDVAARGLDIPDVSHVINFDQPQTYDDYIHRIGRTGRAGKAGKALTFIDKRR